MVMTYKLAPKRTSLLCALGFAWVLFLSGCAASRASVGVNDVPLLPEDMIYQPIAGQAVNVLSDKKTTTVTTTDRMVLTFQDTLVRQNERQNRKVLKDVKMAKVQGAAVGAVVPLLTIVGGILWRSRKKMKLDIKAEA